MNKNSMFDSNKISISDIYNLTDISEIKLNKDNKSLKFHTIANNFLVLEKIGTGMCGSVYKVIDIKTKQMFAVKIVEKNYYNRNIIKSLKKEAIILNKIDKTIGFSTLRIFFKIESFGYLVTNILGQNLQVLLKKYGGSFSLKSICYIAIQLIDRLETLHNLGFIHRDIKPGNVCVGLDGKTICLIDFSLTETYLTDFKKHIPNTKSNKFSGTFLFSSIHCMNGYASSRRDDFISLGYMLIYMLVGKLKWQNLNMNSLNNIKKMKFLKSLNSDILCENLPEQFKEYFNYINALNFDDKPNYDYLKQRFEIILKDKKWSFHPEFEWTIKNYNGIDLNSLKITQNSLEPYKNT